MATYTDRVTVPPNTTPLTSVSHDVLVGSPYIKTISIHFPPGCRGLVYVKLFSTYMNLSENWLRGDNAWLNVDVYRMIEDPYRITVLAYNESIDWEHTIEIRVEFERTKVYRDTRRS